MKELINILSTKVEQLREDLLDLIKVIKLHNQVMESFNERLNKLEGNEEDNDEQEDSTQLSML